ncbi:MAG: hypothetical protein MUF18_09305 [Fimbriiglobus sp.]|jgi:hypothetical protein|nr:hypothetical protein [Fimbriiglobus sp.]
MHRLFPLLPLLLAGCGEPAPLPMAATAESSREALSAALDGWKAGKKPADLIAARPPLTFVDDDVNADAALVEYAVEGEGKPRGTGYAYTVALTLRGKDGKTRTKKTTYIVATNPNLAVIKDDRQ